VGKIFDRVFAGVDTQQIEQWFNLGGTVGLDDNHPAAAALVDLKQIQGLIAKLAPLGITKSDEAPRVVSAAEFLLEGLVAHRKLSRSEERVFAANEKPQRGPERAELEVDFEDWQRARRSPRGGYN
jgi:magnesium chelatase subunit I